MNAIRSRRDCNRTVPRVFFDGLICQHRQTTDDTLLCNPSPRRAHKMLLICNRRPITSMRKDASATNRWTTCIVHHRLKQVHCQLLIQALLFVQHGLSDGRKVVFCEFGPCCHFGHIL